MRSARGTRKISVRSNWIHKTPTSLLLPSFLLQSALANSKSKSNTGINEPVPSTSNRRSCSPTVRRNHAQKPQAGEKPACQPGEITMDSLGCVSPSIVLPNNTGAYHRTRRRQLHISSSSISNQSCFHRSFPALIRSRVRVLDCKCKMNRGGVDGRGNGDKEDEEEVEQALHLDGTIPGTSGEFVKQVSSRAYDMRRHLQQSFESSSYDVLETNPWREDSKPVYVLTHKINQLCTMKTRRNRSEVERELGLLFSKGGKRRPGLGSQQSRSGTKFQMLVEDVREGVLVFEDEDEAASYCDLLQGGGRGCEGVAEVEASSVFDLCRKMRALAVLFRRGRKPPLPQSLELSLRARKRSLEDKEYLI